MSQQEKYNAESRDASELVKDFYERFPYPGPVENLDKYQYNLKDQLKRRVDYHLLWPDRPYKEDSSILVAGCGTSQAAKYAMRWPESLITGIDFSEKSVSSTEKLKKKYNLKNLKIVRLAIENVKELGISFDQIVCTGVLHHLPDPDAGLKALREVLKPEGAMNLMVYAPYGRTGIYMMQEFCRLLDIKASEEGIRNLKRALKALPQGHPLENILSNAPDFNQDAELADVLLNPRDRAYSVPQLFDFINKGGMKFIRWVRQAPYSPRCGVVAQIPQAKEIEKLSLKEQFAAVELFRGTMVRHSLVAYHIDNPFGPDQVSFDNDKWFGYVPIRLPETICVEERLPKGAAGVLINKTHAYKDLFLPIDSAEKLLYNSIDGIRNIGDIAEKTLPSADRKQVHDVSCTFFEKLWWYDQVVFDTSQGV